MKDSFIDIFMIIFGSFATIMLGALVIVGIIYMNDEISIKRSNLCIESGGIVVTDSAGYFESCIRRQ